jgi:regulator of extracellular matrix RemA (YlzA/DUF370 family)
MYQLPLKFIEVSPDVAICATRIVAIMSTKSFQARETIKAERKAGTLINGCGNRTCETAIFLDNGSVIASPYKIPRLLKKIAKATEKNTKGLKKETNDKGIDIESLEETYETDEQNNQQNNQFVENVNDESLMLEDEDGELLLDNDIDAL